MCTVYMRAVEMAWMRRRAHAVPAVRAQWNGFNRSVVTTV